jgi:hypothetical protein
MDVLLILWWRIGNLVELQHKTQIATPMKNQQLRGYTIKVFLTTSQGKSVSKHHNFWYDNSVSGKIW